MPNAAPYAADKAIYHHKSLAILQDGGQPSPTYVQIIPSDLCNQSCGFCAYRSADYDANPLFKVIGSDGSVNINPRRMIPWEKLQEIVRDCKELGVRAILLTGGGEPTLHPQFGELMNLIFYNGIDFSVQTNGLLIGKPAFRGVRNCTWMRISLDAGTPETYAAIRQVPAQEFSIVVRNLESLANIPDRRFTLGVGFVVTKENYHELALATRIARDAGADNIRISAVFQNDHASYFEKFLAETEEQVSAAVSMQTSKFTVCNNFSIKLDDMRLGRPDYEQCHYMHFTTYIGGDQHVYVCCVNSYNPRGDIGSLESQSFRKLWNGHAKRQMFESFDARDCPRCMFNEKNRAIHEMLKPVTGHAAFV